MQKATVVTALITGIVVGAVVWILAPKTGTLVKHPHKKMDCKTMANCKLDITVDCDGALFPVCEPYPDDAEVIQVTATTTALNFKLKTTGYSFDPTDGIKFVVDDPHDQPFACAPVVGNPIDKFSCSVTNPKPTTLYKYSIHVTGLTVVDPWVVNY